MTDDTVCNVELHEPFPVVVPSCVGKTNEDQSTRVTCKETPFSIKRSTQAEASAPPHVTKKRCQAVSKSQHQIVFVFQGAAHRPTHCSCFNLFLCSLAEHQPGTPPILPASPSALAFCFRPDPSCSSKQRSPALFFSLAFQSKHVRSPLFLVATTFAASRNVSYLGSQSSRATPSHDVWRNAIQSESTRGGSKRPDQSSLGPRTPSVHVFHLF